MSQVTRVGEPEGDTVILAVEGEVDLATAPQLREDLLFHARNALTTLVLDLTPLEFIDSSGVRVLFDLSSMLREHGQSLRLVLPEGSQAWRTLQLSGVERMAAVFQTVADATPPSEEGTDARES
jgi:anti-sigma B factor antagonist